MKTYIYRLLALGVLANLVSCGATQQLVVNTMEPSPVAISNDIKKIGIINRTEHIDAQKGVKVIDQILAAEEKWLTENGTDAAITGCETHDVDAIFSLAFYDTDTKISLKKTKMDKADMVRKYTEVAAQEITLETLIENGWRIYDPQNQKLIDEIVFNDQIISKGKGENPVLAYRNIGDRKDTILQRSRDKGSKYGQRLLPFKSAVSRDYYVKGSNNLTQGAKKVAANAWPLSFSTMAYEADKSELYREYKNILAKRLEVQPLVEKQLSAIEFAN